MREAEGLSRLHNTITDWPDSGHYYAFADTNPSEPAQSFRSHATAARRA